MNQAWAGGGDYYPQQQQPKIPVKNTLKVKPLKQIASHVEVPAKDTLKQVKETITDYWWLLAIFAVGIVTFIIAVIRAIKKSKNPIIGELLKMWGVKK